MPARVEVVRTADIAAPRALVHALASDPERLVELHPLITRVRVTGAETRDGRRRVAFEVRERIPLGPIGFPNRYSGAIFTREGDEGLVELEGWSVPGISIRTRLRLEALAPDRTRVVQETEARCPRGLAWFVFPTMRSAHDGAFAETKRVAEALASGAPR